MLLVLEVLGYGRHVQLPGGKTLHKTLDGARTLVLLRHRLLRQANRFEDFAHLAVLADFGDQSVAQPKNVDLLLRKRDTAGPPTTDQANRDDDEVASVDVVESFDVTL